MANPICISTELQENIFIFSVFTEAAHEIDIQVFSKLSMENVN